MHSHGDVFGFPNEIPELPRRNGTQVLVLRKCEAERRDQLEVVRMQLLRNFDLAVDQRAQPSALDRFQFFGLRCYSNAIA
jgi:hypothetical protein